MPVSCDLPQSSGRCSRLPCRAFGFATPPSASWSRRQPILSCRQPLWEPVEFGTPLEDPADRRQLIRRSVDFGASPSNFPACRRLRPKTAVFFETPLFHGDRYQLLEHVAICGELVSASLAAPSSHAACCQLLWSATKFPGLPPASEERRQAIRAGGKLRRSAVIRLVLESKILWMQPFPSSSSLVRLRLINLPLKPYSGLSIHLTEVPPVPYHDSSAYGRAG
jgi:hypothetical protein